MITFSREEQITIHKIFVSELCEELSLVELLIIEYSLKGYNLTEIRKKLHYSHKGFFKIKNKMKDKLNKYYNLIKLN